MSRDLGLHGRIALALALVASVAATTPAAALDLEKLVMPGELIRDHADLESDCEQCHRPFRSEDQEALCRGCHEAVDADLRNGSGFHGLAPGIAQAACRSCHAEHKGRDFDAVGLDRETFDHALTDYPLRGAHRRLACESCHEAEAKHRDAPSDCADCHGDGDPHEGRLGPRCGECHGEQSWRDTRFDHGQTSFPLTGAHREVECALCHAGEHYEGTASDCRSCHGLRDVHRGAFGGDCGRCHETSRWPSSRFDHDRDSHYPLTGRHRGASCEACHRPGSAGPELATDCLSCHRNDDEHRGRNGKRCETCHDTASWSSEKFDHDRMTDFPLRGAHRRVACEGCHEGNLYEEDLATDCRACHRDDDVHRGQEGDDCGRCHREDGWERDLFFDHDLTHFPLLGLHAVAACDQCHLTPRFLDADLRCVACHEQDDVHLRRLGAGCELCHNPNGWRVWRFDHALQTDFPLAGAHAELDCHACHQVAVHDRIRMRGGCDGCHARDDVHQGSYGRDCARCHSDRSWRDIRLGR